MLPAPTLLHALLSYVLLDMRDLGRGDQDCHQLADLFQNVPGYLEAAAQGKLSYDEVLEQLREKAQEKGWEQWLDRVIEQITQRHSDLPINGVTQEVEAHGSGRPV